MKRRISRHAVDHSRAVLVGKDSTAGRIATGYVVTAWGIVGAYTFTPDEAHKTSTRPETALSFVVLGQEHSLFEYRSYTQRGLAILAGKFASRAALQEGIR